MRCDRCQHWNANAVLCKDAETLGRRVCDAIVDKAVFPHADLEQTKAWTESTDYDRASTVYTSGDFFCALFAAKINQEPHTQSNLECDETLPLKEWRAIDCDGSVVASGVWAWDVMRCFTQIRNRPFASFATGRVTIIY